MTGLEEAVTYDGRSPDRKRPGGPSDTTLRLYDLMAMRPDGITVDEAAGHLALGFPTDAYRAYLKILERRRGGPERPGGPDRAEWGTTVFKERAHRWKALRTLYSMKHLGTAIQQEERWFAGRPPLIARAGQRIAYVPGEDAAKTAERVQTINTITMLRQIQRRLRNERERDAIEDAIRHIRRGV